MPWPPGNTKTVTVDASKSQIVLPNLTPGVTYDVSVIAVKGQRDSEAASESVTTGKLLCMWQWNKIHTRPEHLPFQPLPISLSVRKSVSRSLRGNTDKGKFAFCVHIVIQVGTFSLIVSALRSVNQMEVNGTVDYRSSCTQLITYTIEQLQNTLVDKWWSAYSPRYKMIMCNYVTLEHTKHIKMKYTQFSPKPSFQDVWKSFV